VAYWLLSRRKEPATAGLEAPTAPTQKGPIWSLPGIVAGVQPKGDRRWPGTRTQPDHPSGQRTAGTGRALRPAPGPVG